MFEELQYVLGIHQKHCCGHHLRIVLDKDWRRTKWESLEHLNIDVTFLSCLAWLIIASIPLQQFVPWSLDLSSSIDKQRSGVNWAMTMISGIILNIVK